MITLATGLLLVSGCKKAMEPGLNDQIMAVTIDQVLLDELDEELFDDITFLDEYFLAGLKDGRLDCRTVTVEPEERGVWPKTFTIDFGDGCELREGMVKKGKMIITQSGPLDTRRWKKVVTYEDYYVNGNQIEGTHTITFSVGSGNPVWTHTVEGSRITKEDGQVITREADHTRVQTRGTDTPRIKTDDVYQISGSASGINRKGVVYSTSITEPIRIFMGCRWIISGVKEIQVEGESLVILDYGDGTCDNKATVTKDGETREITLRPLRR